MWMERTEIEDEDEDRVDKKPEREEEDGVHGVWNGLDMQDMDAFIARVLEEAGLPGGGDEYA
jgi:hypothetical protein